jgi:MFS family permease
MEAGGIARERDLRVLSAAIGLSALGDGVALVALALQAKNLSGEGMGGGLAISAMFICLWAPVVLLSGHVGLLVDRVETRKLLVVVSLGQAAVAVALALVGSLVPLLALAAVLGSEIAVAQAAEFALVPVVAGDRALQRANGLVETARSLGFTLGPVCGSLLVAAGGTSLAMTVDAASFVVVAAAGVVVQGLGKVLAQFWRVIGFMIACYFVGGIGHGVKNVASRTLIHARIPSERHGRAFAAWNGVRNAAELGALAVGGAVVGAIGARPTLWLAGGLSAIAGLGGLAVLAAWRGRVPRPEPEAGVGTIGSP